uniref:Uncharacterized protein LOC102803778 n=1 Tax=Saccoglossus kowalevskii TaxID=10224 RepID=A0ABM0LUK5_SACKO|nr:PREDICTED: uncharacterized protein LOC102803778 [Saccoglossus kowalevskii]
MIYGIPLIEDYTVKPLEYLLIAWDSSGLNTRDAMQFILQPSVTVFSHQFVITFKNDFTEFMSSGQNRYDLATKITDYYEESDAKSITVDSISKGSVVWVYSNNSLPTDKCDLIVIDALYAKLADDAGVIQASFQQAMQPQFLADTAQRQLTGICGPVTIPSQTTQAVVIVQPVISERETWEKAVIPALIFAIVLLLLGCVVCIVYRRKRPGTKFLLRVEKPMYTKDRRPIILPDERKVKQKLKPVQPAILRSDISPFQQTQPSKPVPPPPPEIQDIRPPSPPPYRLPPYPDNMGGYPDYPDNMGEYPNYPTEGALPPSPPAYSHQPDYGRPPPNYRLPPPYNPVDMKTSNI